MAGRIRCRAALVLAAACRRRSAPSCSHRAPLRRAPAGPQQPGLAAAGLGSTPAPGAAGAAGPLALVSQSGALTTAMLDWARGNGVGFSTVVSLGPNTAVELPQVLRRTQSILVYMEGIRTRAAS
jgi:acetyltransferase